MLGLWAFLVCLRYAIVSCGNRGSFKMVICHLIFVIVDLMTVLVHLLLVLVTTKLGNLGFKLTLIFLARLMF